MASIFQDFGELSKEDSNSESIDFFTANSTAKADALAE